MKSRFFILCLTLLFSSLYGQNSTLVFYTNEPSGFSIILNGVLQNPEPEINVRITDLPQPYYKVKILFADKRIPPIEKNVTFNQGTETVFAIKTNNKGEYVLRWQSETPLAQAPPPLPQQKVYVFTTTPRTAAAATTTTTTTTATSGGGAPKGENVSFGIEAGEGGVKINVQAQEQSQSSGSVVTQSTTTTTTTYGVAVAPEPVKAIPDHYVMPGYNGPIGCPWPVSDQEFQNMKQSISSKSFEDSKLTMAKQVVRSNCLFSHQVHDIMKLFSFEESRLDVAKFAYGYTYDPGNYYKVNDAFDFELSIEELNEHIGSSGR